MKIRGKRLLKLILTVVALSLCVLLTGGPSIAKVVTEESKLNYSSNVSYRDTEMAKILSVLEDRLGSQTVTEKVREKVLNLGDRRIRLIASLAEIITDDRQTAGADIGFFVITVLIIVS